MSLKKNTKAPDFTLPSTAGKDFRLAGDFKGKPALIFFYPKDQTKGCTQEVCSFRDNFGVFSSLDISLVGISRDSIASHQEFKKMHQLPFELLSDEDGSVCKQYKALMPLIKIPKRITYLLNDAHEIVAIHEGLFDGPAHVKSMMEEVKELGNR
ncbi:peroxiredoxin [Echinicola strongylocentroti]|uniref:thioredoxin-dependent peroxiredoxin n=1 Tax=Echinicola strongylocentroti TaxID=1795355 RepID=A0A2Z4INX8_9BACT|nr:peroxiredoxin [Echinicola strongylocentroti]AWW32460.1 peroxiredoxin [Echinicola strongylocentroti]